MVDFSEQSAPEEMDLPLEMIDGSRTQTRATIRQQAVLEYAAALQSGQELPRLVVFCDEQGQYLLSSGFHRLSAYRLRGAKEVPCLVYSGGLWDAIAHGIRDNAMHKGERITAKDIEHSVKLCLKARADLSDRAIAELCSVSHPTVGKYRRDLQSSGDLSQGQKRTSKNGKTFDAPAGRDAEAGDCHDAVHAGDSAEDQLPEACGTATAVAESPVVAARKTIKKIEECLAKAVNHAVDLQNAVGQHPAVEMLVRNLHLSFTASKNLSTTLR